MFSMKHMSAALSATAFMLQPTLAAAQNVNCITEEEISDTAIYAVPNLILAMRARCGPSLSAEGFLAQQGSILSSRYMEHQEVTWPGARSTFFKFASMSTSEHKQYIDMIAGLPDESIRPLLDAMITETIAEKFATKNCGKVERVLEAIAPIEPEVAGPLIAVIFSLAEVKDPPVCPVEPA